METLERLSSWLMWTRCPGCLGSAPADPPVSPTSASCPLLSLRSLAAGWFHCVLRATWFT